MYNILFQTDQCTENKNADILHTITSKTMISAYSYDCNG